MGVSKSTPLKSSLWEAAQAQQEKMRSQLVAQFMPFFRLIARILVFCDKKYHILKFCNKTESYLTILQQNNIEGGMLKIRGHDVI